MSIVTNHRTAVLRAVAGAAVLSAAVAMDGGSPAAATPTPASATQSVIVVLRNQLTSTPANRAHVATRRSDARSQQSAVLRRLGSAGGRAATKVVHYTAANALSLTVTAGQVATLRRDPSVAAVIPNTKVSVTVPTAPKVAAPTRQNRAAVAPPAGACPTDPSKPLLEPEALQDTNTASDNPSAKTAQQLVDGTGVKVAYIADGIDPNNADFIRADGSHVITDYKAFAADGPNPTEGGAEAYGDASSIAAQGLVSHDLSTFVNPAYPLPTGCNIRILGMSPGASIVALKIDFYTSSIVQAIDYAVSTDHVDVINESFGGNVTPDAGARSAISLFNDMAVAAGATVTVSSGDAGTTSTIGNPATDPKVISVGADTISRSYAQTGYAGARYFSNGKWINDQISSLSSGGFTQSGNTIDLVAPGEAGWAACDSGAPECTNYAGGHSNFQLFGGTSQSAPLTAGAAALVIQAYRKTHGGVSPSPTNVKRFLTSTSRDLGLPTFEQGSGLLNSRAAVEAALTAPGTSTTPPAGLDSNIVLSGNKTTLSGAPGSKQSVAIGVTNVGTKKVTVAASTRDYVTTAVSTQTAALDSTSTQTFPYPTTGAPWVYKKVTFTVPSGTDRLAEAMIWQGAAKQVGTATVTPVVRLTLLDPSGAYVANSRPQGGPVSANYANLDVRNPAAGVWTAVLYTPAGASGYTGNVTLEGTSQQAVQVGTVSPAVTVVQPKQSVRINVTLKIPSSGGDASQAITIASSGGHQVAVSVAERAIVATSSGTGSFSGVITGGNARGGSAAQVFTYAFDVPAGKKDLSVGVKLANDAGDQLEGVLVDPHDETQDINSNAHTDASGNQSGQDLNMQLTTAKPIAGRWRVIILAINPVTGKELREPFTGTIAFDQNKIVATGLPTSTRTTLPQGRDTTVTVKVTNTGIAPINVQVDARGSTLKDIPLTSPFGKQSFQLPAHAAPTFLVPPNTTSLTATANSSVPALVELLDSAQGIDVVGDLNDGKSGNTISSATVSEPTGTVGTGIWFTDVNEIGAVGDAGSPTADSHVDLSAKTPEFDTDVTSSTGDFWKLATDPSAGIGSALTIKPGDSAFIPVTITPTAAVGTKVSGVLNIVTPPAFSYPTFNTTGSVLAQLPYSYTVAPAATAARR